MVDIKVVELESVECMAIEEEVDNDKIPAVMGRAFQDLSVFFQKNNVVMVGPPFAYYHSWGDRKTRMTVGFPVTHQTKSDGRVGPFTLPGGTVANAMHIGPYNKLVESYMAMHAWMSNNQLVPADKMWEVYLTDPDQEKDPEKWMTSMYWPCAKQ
ncbi:MAG TPA: GyrI-like domain-containing protein [Methanomassiliicoccales archaeon]|nr:GyrI-like domain-containing protein [Methanomassiliicoccales archaeon]